jgi:hypothetical protein
MITQILDFGTARHTASKMQRSSASAINFRPVMDAIAADMMRVTEANFSSQGRRGGGSWAELRPETVERKHGDTRILLTSGNPYAASTGVSAMYKSVTRPNQPGGILAITKTTIVYGTDLPYAHRQARGGKGIPPRPFINFTPADRARWDALFARHVLMPFRTGEPYFERFR